MSKKPQSSKSVNSTKASPAKVKKVTKPAKVQKRPVKKSVKAKPANKTVSKAFKALKKVPAKSPKPRSGPLTTAKAPKPPKAPRKAAELSGPKGYTIDQYKRFLE